MLIFGRISFIDVTINMILIEHTYSLSQVHEVYSSLLVRSVAFCGAGNVDFSPVDRLKESTECGERHKSDIICNGGERTRWEKRAIEVNLISAAVGSLKISIDSLRF